MKNPFALLICALLSACASSPVSQGEERYALLVGKWRAVEDSALILDISGACCGERSRLTGTIQDHGLSMPLMPGSNVIDYTVIKPDSGAQPLHEFEVYLELRPGQPDSLCGMDGFALDEIGNRAFATDSPSGIRKLSLTKWVLNGPSCEPSQDTVEWVRIP